jgi:orotate phosphoribosyltransferase-like protein
MEDVASKNSSVLKCVFVASVTSIPSRCLATIGGYTYRHIPIAGIHAVEMGSDAMIYIPRPVQQFKIVVGEGGIRRHTGTMTIS